MNEIDAAYLAEQYLKAYDRLMELTDDHEKSTWMAIAVINAILMHQNACRPDPFANLLKIAFGEGEIPNDEN